MISILIPTRGRPRQFSEVVYSVCETVRGTAGWEIIARLDDDDPLAEEYSMFTDITVRHIIGPRIVLSNMWNKCAAVARGDIFCQGNDDIIFRTPGWDQVVEQEFANYPDRIVMVHGNDGSQGYGSGTGQFAPHPFVHRRWYETLGYFTPPYFSSDFGDTWINELANGIGRRRYHPFTIEHMHFIFGKAETDKTTSERLERHSRDMVDVLYRDLAPLRQADIDKLRAVMQ